MGERSAGGACRDGSYRVTGDRGVLGAPILLALSASSSSRRYSGAIPIRPRLIEAPCLPYWWHWGCCAWARSFSAAGSSPCLQGPPPLPPRSAAWVRSGLFLLALAPGLGGVEPLAFGLGTAAVALGYVALTLAWASSLLAMDGRSALLVMVIGYAFGSLAPLTDLASQRAALGFTLLAPVGSAVAWLLCRPDGASVGRTPDYSLGGLRRLPATARGHDRGLPLCGTHSRGAFVSLEARIALLVRVVDVAVAFGFMGVMLVLVRGKGPEDWAPSIKVAWVVLALVAIAGMLLMLAGLPRYFVVGEGLVAAAFNCFELLLWILLVRLARERALSVALLFCFVFCICKVVPVFCWQAARSVDDCPGGIARGYGVCSAPTCAGVPSDCGNIRVFGLWRCHMGRRGCRDGRAVSRWQRISWVRRFGGHPAPTGLVSEERVRLYGLTPRELEVMGCVLRGYSYQKTAAEMGLSLSTVQSHAKNLYRKCGVHTKDELVEWVHGRG